MFKSTTVLFPRYHTGYRYGDYTIRGVRPHAHFWHTSVDGSWEFIANSRGHRNLREFAYGNPDRSFRVLSLGDSHTLGFEVRQGHTYSAVLERALAAHLQRAEVINTGVSGFSTAEELVLLENEAIEYLPQAVVVGFFANDYEDNVRTGLFALDGEGALIRKTMTYLPGVAVQDFIYGIPFVPWLSENSYLYSVLFNEIWIYYKRQRTAAAHQSNVALTDPPARRDSDFEQAVPGKENHPPQEVALAAALIERINEVCKARQIRLIVVDIPSPADPYGFRSSLTPQLVDHLQRAGVEFIASSDLFKELEGSVELHVPNGHRHISELAHALIGIELAKRLAPMSSAPASK